ncbi:MAG: hypothetical protein WAL71_12320 [Terriglobales bacterium]|jgi:uncharacterized Zn finger protein (UPF0148 family)
MTSNKMTSDMTASNDNLESLCQHCGQALSDFLREMENHNAEVVCPSCGKPQDANLAAGAQRKAQKEKEIDAAGGLASSVNTQAGNRQKAPSRARLEKG